MRKSSSRLLALTIFGLALSASSVSAQPEPDEEPDEETDEEPVKKAAPPPEVEKKDEKKDEKKEEGISLGGRVFVRDTITKLKTDGSQFQNDFSLDSVRANIDLRKYGWLRVGIEVSFEEDGEIDVEDTFIRTDFTSELRFEAGRFKRPMSPIALESAWSLPNTERGLLSDDVAVGDLDVPLNLGGRANGAMISYNSDTGLEPEFYLGVFNADLPRRGGGGADLEDLADNPLRDVYARAQVELISGLDVGGSFAVVTRARTASRLQSKYIGSLDLVVDTDAFRAWLEGFAGNTTVFDGVESVGTMLALRVLIAPQFDDPVDHVRRIEPFVIFSALDPTDARDNDRAVEVGAGFAIWFRKLLRFQADYTYNAYEDQFPSPTFSLLDRSTIRLQLGSQFR